MRLLKVFFVLASTCLFAAASRADTYQIKTIGSGNAQGFVGLTDSGSVLFARGAPCPTGAGQTSASGSCVLVINTDGTESFSPTVPNIDFTRASSRSVISNGAFTVAVTSPRDGSLTVTTPRGVQQIFPNGGFGFDTLYNLDPLGDFTFCDCIQDNYYEAIDLTTRQAPEPGGLALLGTGVVSAVGLLRRRRS